MQFNVTRPAIAALASAACLVAVYPAAAESVYLGLGDSITFGETDLAYIQSDGDQGYVAEYADVIAGRTGERPIVLNFAIDGETADSFTDGTGRVPPVEGRTDIPLALQNLSYDEDNLLTQQQQFQMAVADQAAAGNTIDTVSITLGFNDLATTLQQPDPIAAIDPTLATYRTQYDAILDEIRAALPDAELLVLNYFNPFPADPDSPAAPVFNAGGAQLNAIIADLAAKYDATLVDTFTPFVGNEAEYTFLDEFPAGQRGPRAAPLRPGHGPDRQRPPQRHRLRRHRRPTRRRHRGWRRRRRRGHPHPLRRDAGAGGADAARHPPPSRCVTRDTNRRRPTWRGGAADFYFRCSGGSAASVLDGPPTPVTERVFKTNSNKPRPEGRGPRGDEGYFDVAPWT